MPRVYLKTRGPQGRDRICGRSGRVIQKGEQFYEWSFRYGGSRYQLAEFGHPRQSQLTQSRMGEVYAEIENIEDMICNTFPDEWCLEDAADALDQAAQVAQEIADEARSTADEYFGGGGPHAERADQMESTQQSLEDAAQSVRELEDEYERSQEDPVEDEDAEEFDATEKVQEILGGIDLY